MALRRVIVTGNRLFHSGSIMSKEQMDKLSKNPYYASYAEKIAKLQKTSPEEFLNRLEAMETVNKPKKSSIQEKDFSLPSKPKKDSNVSKGMVKEKKLESIMKVELLKDKTKDEIGSIWREHYKNKDAVSAVIPYDTFKEMKTRFEEFNTFLFPLPRKEGYEFVVVQFSGNEAHFTTLINFQAYHENAPECLTIVHYPDLAEDKGVVLMVGEFDTNVLTHSESVCLCCQMLLYYGEGDLTQEPNQKRLRHLMNFTHCADSAFDPFDLIAELETIQEAQCLANQVEMYYFKPKPEKARLLEQFLMKPNEFKHTDLIAQLENIALDISSVANS